MKKKLIIGGLAVLVIVGSFSVGVSAEKLGVVDKIKGTASKDIGAAGYNKKAELLDNIDSQIESKMAESVNPLVDEKEAMVEQELQAYFDAKLNAIVDQSLDSGLGSELDEVANGIIERYKAEIDNALEGY